MLADDVVSVVALQPLAPAFQLVMTPSIIADSAAGDAPNSADVI